MLNLTGHYHVSVHPLGNVFAKRRLRQASAKTHRGIRERQLRAYLDFLRQRAIRNDRPMDLPRYWNALVNESMTAIDPQWPAIEDVITTLSPS